MNDGRMGGGAGSVTYLRAASPVRTLKSRGIAGSNTGARKNEKMGYVRSNI